MRSLHLVRVMVGGPTGGLLSHLPESAGFFHHLPHYAGEGQVGVDDALVLVDDASPGLCGPGLDQLRLSNEGEVCA